MDEEKICENCKYYIKHYYWFRGRLATAYSGHCIAHRKHLVLNTDSCKKWVTDENEQDIQNEEFKAILKRTAKQIDEIASILSYDKKTPR